MGYMMIDTAHGSIYYEYFPSKKKKAQTIIYLHGLGGDCRAWDFMIKPTCDAGYNCIVLDFPGHGLSYRPENNFQFEEFLESLDSIILYYQIDKPILVGHCMGGSIALAYACQNQGKIEKLILFNIGFLFPQWFRFLQYIVPMSNLIPNKSIHKHIDHIPYEGTGDFYIPRFIVDIIHMGLRSYILLFESLLKMHTQHDISQIDIPVLVVGGKSDKILPLKHQNYLSKQIPNAKLEILDTNHISIFNVKEEVKKCIFDELRRNKGI